MIPSPIIWINKLIFIKQIAPDSIAFLFCIVAGINGYTGDWIDEYTDRLQVLHTNNDIIADPHTTNQLHTKCSQSISTNLYLVTAVRSGNSSAMSSLDLSWHEF
jgi:hypothetical protein